MNLSRPFTLAAMCILNGLLFVDVLNVPPAHADDFSVNSLTSTRTHKENGIPLYDAALAGKSAEVKRLIAAGSDVNAVDSRNRAPLHAGVIGGRIEIVRSLLKAGSKVDVACMSNNGGCLIRDDGLTGTPLHWAAQMGQIDIARLLIEHGADVNSQRTRWKDTPLHLVGQQGGVMMAELLIKHGARLNVSGGFDNTSPLYESCRFGKAETARVMIANGADVNSANEYGDTPLHAAVRIGNLEIVKMLLANRVKMNSESRIGTKRLLPGGFSSEIGGTPLHIANHTKHVEIARILKAKGAVDTGHDERGYAGLRHQSPKTASSEPFVSSVKSPSGLTTFKSDGLNPGQSSEWRPSGGKTWEERCSNGDVNRFDLIGPKIVDDVAGIVLQRAGDGLEVFVSTADGTHSELKWHDIKQDLWHTFAHRRP